MLEIMTGTVGVLVVALGAFIVIFMLLTVAVAVSALLWYRALATLSDRSGVELFRWSAILYVIGAILLVAGLLLLVVLVGMIILLVAEILGLASFILLALGFSSLKPPATQAPPESTETHLNPQEVRR